MGNTVDRSCASSFLTFQEKFRSKTPISCHFRKTDDTENEKPLLSAVAHHAHIYYSVQYTLPLSTVPATFKFRERYDALPRYLNNYGLRMYSFVELNHYS